MHLTAWAVADLKSKRMQERSCSGAFPENYNVGWQHKCTEDWEYGCYLLPVTCVLRPILQASYKLPRGLDLAFHPQPRESPNDRVNVCTWTWYDIWNSYFGSDQSLGRFPASEGYISNLRPCTAMLCSQVAAACSPSASSSSASTRGSCCSETCFPKRMQRKRRIATEDFTLLVCWRFHKNLCGFQVQVGLRGHLFSQEAFRLTFLQPPNLWDFTLETKANVLYI